MGFSKISTLSLTELFVQQVENMILSGELKIGEQIPPARELSIRMGVSRPVISAGVVELEKMGFVEVRPRQGVYVCDYRRKGTLETLVAIMRYNGGAMRCNEVRSLFEVKQAMECLCVRLLLKRASEDELASLEPLVESINQAENYDLAAERVFGFHHEMAVLSGNALLPLMYHSFRPEGMHLFALFCKSYGIPAMYRLKRNLLEALLRRDCEDAIAQTNDVMRRAIENLDIYGV